MATRDFRIARKTRIQIGYEEALFANDEDIDSIQQQAKEIVYRYNSWQKVQGGNAFVSEAKFFAVGVLHMLYQAVISRYLAEQDHDFFSRLTTSIIRDPAYQEVIAFYAHEFPSPLLTGEHPNAPYFMEESERALFVHYVLLENPAIVNAAAVFIKPEDMQLPPAFQALFTLMAEYTKSAPSVEHTEDLLTFLTKPARQYPDSLADQIAYILRTWGSFVPDAYRRYLLRAIDAIQEEEQPRFFGGPGLAGVPTYDRETEYEAYSLDQPWMPNVVMIAKSTLVWLDQLSSLYGFPIKRLDQIPDEQLDILAERGFNALWLIGIWERSKASKRIKHLCGNSDAQASAYALYSYDIAADLGGWSAFENLDARCKTRRIRLASDMVPNHTGIDSDWVINHPQYFMQSAFSPFPSYTFNKENLSPDSRIEIKIEDHYYDRSDAAVVFRRVDHQKQETSYIFHGNDGTSMPWNDTAQLDFLNPETREAVMQQILTVARRFHIIRFDAAMTLVCRHFERLWYPKPGSGGAIPGRSAFSLSEEEFARNMPQEFWRQVVDRVEKEVPDTLLLAEAFWMMEGYFVRTLGMHRVYNSAFMHMLRDQENKKYRDTIKNTLSFDPEILKRFVNFMNNPDEETAITQFGNGDKYFGICTLLATMPGLPLFGHGQIEGFHEKYGMEYGRAYWNEYPDEHLVEQHRKRIFPLLKRRALFSGVEHFELFDAVDEEHIAQSIYVYVNGIDTQRALVLYNNQYEHAQGRITISCPKLTRLPDGSRAPKTKTLGESLSLHPGGRNYVVYESFPERLTFLMPSLAVFDTGWWVSLNGYETRVYWHVREMEDFDGSLEVLFAQLGTKGTRTFEESLRAIRLRPLFKALENFKSPQMIELATLLVKSTATATEVRKFILLAGEAYARLFAAYEAMSQQTRDAIGLSLREVQAHDIVSILQNISYCLTEEKGNRMFSIGAAVLMELPYLLNLSLLLMPFLQPGCTIDEAIAIADNLLLNEFFPEAATLFGVPAKEASSIMRSAVFLASVPPCVTEALNNQGIDGKKVLEELFASEAFKNQVGYNVYQEVAWYHKEAFQESIFLIALGACMQRGEPACKSMTRMLTDWLRRDSIAAYRVENLFR